MEISSHQKGILNSIESSFSNQYKKIRENISLVAYSIMRCQNVNTAEIARHMTEVNGLGFKANDMKVYRLLQSNNFQVDDKMWRGHIRLLFKMIKENNLKKDRSFIINVDYTSDRDDFLILCASIVIQGESIPLYFSMRKYQKRPGMHDQKKLEAAFFKALRHLLPKKYEYTIVADRGFGLHRIIEYLEENNFKYVLRLNKNLNIEKNGKVSNIKDLPHKNMRINKVRVVKWDKEISLVKCIKDKKSWILATNHSDENSKKARRYYEDRFSIEKMFKNKKSGGFDLERLRVEKYDRFKRLLFIACVAYSIMIFAGLLIRNKSHPIKKNFSLTVKLLLAFSP
jgi:hypothetical protein